MRLLSVAIILTLSWSPLQIARADVKPHGLFTDGMVLQQQKDPTTGVPVWGTADPGEKVVVALETTKGETSGTVTADMAGRWLVSLPLPKAGGPYSMIIRGKNIISLKDVFVGEVWIASGESNMEWSLRNTVDAEKTINESANPTIRLFRVVHKVATEPQIHVDGRWLECKPETVADFSAVAFTFGRDLHKKLNVPIGLIQTSRGNTVAEAWIRKEALDAVPQLKHLNDQIARDSEIYEKACTRFLDDLEKYVKAARQARADHQDLPPLPYPPPKSPNTPTVLYNSMIAPLIPFAIKGVIWYQGESNVPRADEYNTLLPTMIGNWRKDWNQGDFPFLFVQVGPFGPRVEPHTELVDTPWSRLREAQRLTLRLPNTAMVVITDAGDKEGFHPRKKEPVGARLALAARALAYGEKIEYSGPTFERMRVEDGKAVLTFKHAEGGLVEKGTALAGFTIAGEDKVFYNADAEIQGDAVTVSCAKVAKPVAVRFGWASNPVANLWNKEGLPASPFRTDDWAMFKKQQPKK
jgi:sialate O-acetylesterase